MLKRTYSLRFTVLLAAVATLYLAVLLRPPTEPVVNLWVAGFSLALFLVSLFVPRNDGAKN
jgi:hypothetical protein